MAMQSKKVSPRPASNGLGQTITVTKTRQQSLPSLAVMQGKVLEEARKELAFPQCVKTYDKMTLETNVATAVSIFETMFNRSEWSIKAPSKASKFDREIAAKLNTNLHEMVRPWAEYIGEIGSILKYGFCPLEKIYVEKVTDGKSWYGWEHFPIIAQNTVENWYFNDTTGALAGLKQNVTGIRERSYNSKVGGLEAFEKDIRKDKFILFRYNPKKDNPEGLSPLRACWLTWRYLSVIEEYEVIGITKDLGGTIVRGYPEEVMAAAFADPNSWQADLIEKGNEQAAAITAGDQTDIVKTNKFDEKGNALYTIELLSNKSTSSKDTNSVATRHANKILMAFFADVLKLGTDGSGSFALADSKTSTLAMAIESILLTIQRTLNHDLIKQTYELNKWPYDHETAARFVFSDLEREDIAVLAKAIQQVVAVGAMRPTTDIEDSLREKLLNLEPMSDVQPTLLSTENNSGAGKGMEEGLPNGTGTSTSKGGDRSSSNKSNVLNEVEEGCKV